MRFIDYFYNEYLLEANSDKRKEFLKNKYKGKIVFRDFNSLVEQSSEMLNRFLFTPRYTTKIDLNFSGLKTPESEKMVDELFYDTYDIPELPKLEKTYNDLFLKLAIDKVVERIDPTNGKYSDWILKCIAHLPWIKILNFIREDGESVLKPLIRLFDRYKSEIKTIDREFGYDSILYNTKDMMDINKFKSFDMFYTFVERVPEIFEDKLSQEEEREAEKQVDKIYNSDNWLVLIPKTEQAAKVYGKGTRWCTAAREHNMFSNYDRQGPLYIFIDKNTQEKFQFHFQSKQFMDSRDHEIDTIDFYMENEELRPLLLKISKENDYDEWEKYEERVKLEIDIKENNGDNSNDELKHRMKQFIDCTEHERRNIDIVFGENSSGYSVFQKIDESYTDFLDGFSDRLLPKEIKNYLKYIKDGEMDWGNYDTRWDYPGVKDGTFDLLLKKNPSYLITFKDYILNNEHIKEQAKNYLELEEDEELTEDSMDEDQVFDILCKFGDVSYIFTDAYSDALRNGSYDQMVESFMDSHDNLILNIANSDLTATISKADYEKTILQFDSIDDINKYYEEGIDSIDGDMDVPHHGFDGYSEDMAIESLEQAMHDIFE